MSAYTHLILTVFIVFTVTACGGGGGGGGDVNSGGNDNLQQLPENTVPVYTDKNVGLPPLPTN